eukprot:4628700-Pleurochrysis_carterae.AAC.1
MTGVRRRAACAYACGVRCVCALCACACPVCGVHCRRVALKAPRALYERPMDLLARGLDGGAVPPVGENQRVVEVRLLAARLGVHAHKAQAAACELEAGQTRTGGGTNVNWRRDERELEASSRGGGAK